MSSNRCHRFALVTALAATSVFALPAGVQAALPDRTALTVDCSQGSDAEGDDNDHGIAPGEVLTVTLVNCSGFNVSDEFDDGNAVTVVGAQTLTTSPILVTTSPFLLTIDGVAEILFEQASNPDNTISLDVFLGYEADDPEGSLLSTSPVTFNRPLSELEIPDTPEFENPDDPDEALLGGIPNCDLEPGPHIFREIEITITIAGTYTFRKIWVDPISEDLFWGVGSPRLGDSFLALYQGFDPSEPMSNVVACNDDVDELALWDDASDFEDATGGADDAIITTSGFLIDDQFPWLIQYLEAGTYTLIVMGYGTSAANEWSGSETIAYEFWGPEGGISDITIPTRNSSTGPWLDLRNDYLESYLERTENVVLPDTR